MQEKPHNTATLKQFIADHIRRWTVFLFYLQSYLIVLGFLYFGYITNSLNTITFIQTFKLSEVTHLLSCAQAAEMSTSISVSATVIPNAKMMTHFQTSQLIITPADIRRGYVDVDGASHFSVLTNSRSGYILEINPIGYIFESVMVDGLGETVQVSGDGGTIAKRGLITPAMSFQLKYRFILRSDVQAGVYGWPVQLSVRALP